VGAPSGPGYSIVYYPVPSVPTTNATYVNTPAVSSSVFFQTDPASVGTITTGTSAYSFVVAVSATQATSSNSFAVAIQACSGTTVSTLQCTWSTPQTLTACPGARGCTGWGPPCV
jgi:hypothetical protein